MIQKWREKKVRIILIHVRTNTSTHMLASHCEMKQNKKKEEEEEHIPYITDEETTGNLLERRKDGNFGSQAN